MSDYPSTFPSGATSAEHRPRERGGLILKPAEKRGHCQTCEPTPKGRVSASDLWARLLARGYGSVRIDP